MSSVRLMLSRDWQSSTFHRGVFDEKGNRTELLKFERGEPVELTDDKHLLAVENDIGGPLVVPDDRGKGDHEATNELVLQICEEKLDRKQELNIHQRLAWDAHQATADSDDADDDAADETDGKQGSKKATKKKATKKKATKKKATKKPKAGESKDPAE